jgi:hypothetical protein
MPDLTIRSTPGPDDLIRVAIDELGLSHYLAPDSSALLWDDGQTSITAVRGAGTEIVILLRPTLVPAVEAAEVIRPAA